MPRQIAFYVTGHGFGHSTRVAALINALWERAPDVQALVITSAPEWLFRLNLRRPFTYRHLVTDVGTVQRDALHLDVDETLARCRAFLDGQEEVQDGEARLLKANGVDLVMGDIPPMAFEIAQRLGVPGVAMTNFSWDWIYTPYARGRPGFTEIIDRIRRGYGRANLLLRLPLHGDLSAFPAIRDIPLVTRQAVRGRAEVRAALGFPKDARLILLSFGGFDARGIPFDRLGELAPYQFLVTMPVSGVPPNVHPVGFDGLLYEDIVAASDAVLTKPGYGIVADCLANRVPVIYTSRGEFPEYEALVEGLHAYGHAVYISHDDLFSGNWQPSLEAALGQTPAWKPIRLDGAAVAADLLLGTLGRDGGRG